MYKYIIYLPNNQIDLWQDNGIGLKLIIWGKFSE